MCPYPTSRSAEFWDVMEQSRSVVQNSTQVPAWLEEYLQMQSVEYISDFDAQLQERFCLAYDAGVWAAAILMLGVCGDDKFVDFRGWLVAQGRKVYERTLEDPDTLAEIQNIDGDGGRPLLFHLRYAPETAYRAKIGNDLADLPNTYEQPQLLNEDKWREWNEDQRRMAVAFPQLFRKYRGASSSPF